MCMPQDMCEYQKTTFRLFPLAMSSGIERRLSGLHGKHSFEESSCLPHYLCLFFVSFALCVLGTAFLCMGVEVPEESDCPELGYR